MTIWPKSTIFSFFHRYYFYFSNSRTTKCQEFWAQYDWQQSTLKLYQKLRSACSLHAFSSSIHLRHDTIYKISGTENNSLSVIYYFILQSMTYDCRPLSIFLWRRTEPINSITHIDSESSFAFFCLLETSSEHSVVTQFDYSLQDQLQSQRWASNLLSR